MFILQQESKLTEIAIDKYSDYNEKYDSRTKYGWYRYNTHFGIPVYDEKGNLEQYNIFSTRMLVRCDENRKLYLYDFVRIKKWTRRMSNSWIGVNFISLS